MAEATRAWGNLQLDTEGGLVPEGLFGLIPSRHHSSLVKHGAGLVMDDLAAAGATKAGRKMAGGCFASEIGVTKADEAAGSFAGEIGVTKADEVAGSFPGEIGATKADVGNKEAAGSFTGEIGITQADAGNKEGAGTITGDINVIKAGVGAAGKGVVTEVDWVQFVFPKPPVGLLERKAVPPAGALITKELVPDVIIERLKVKRPFLKLPPINIASGLYNKFPKNREIALATIAHWNYLVDLQADVMNQYEKLGFAEVGVDFSDGGKKVFILPKVGCTRRAP